MGKPQHFSRKDGFLCEGLLCKMMSLMRGNEKVVGLYNEVMVARITGFCWG